MASGSPGLFLDGDSAGLRCAARGDPLELAGVTEVPGGSHEAPSLNFPIPAPPHRRKISERTREAPLGLGAPTTAGRAAAREAHR